MRYEIQYMPAALQPLRRLPAREQRMAVDAIDSQLTHPAEVETRHRKRMRPNRLATWELRVSDLRVFYEVEPAEDLGPPTVVILAIGIKRGSRLWIGDEEVQL